MTDQTNSTNDAPRPELTPHDHGRLNLLDVTSGGIDPREALAQWSQRWAYGIPAAPTGFAAGLWQGRRLAVAGEQTVVTLPLSEGLHGAGRAMLVAGTIGLLDAGMDRYAAHSWAHGLFKPSLAEVSLLGLASNIGGWKTRIGLSALTWLSGRVYNYYSRTR